MKYIALSVSEMGPCRNDKLIKSLSECDGSVK